MKIICFTLMLGCLTTVSALAGDSEEKARDSLLYCGQFLIAGWRSRNPSMVTVAS
jgi:hypothetical protein